MDNSSSIQSSKPLFWQTIVDGIIEEGYTSNAPAAQITQVALRHLESLVNQTTPEASQALFELLKADPRIDFSAMERHINICAKAFKWTPEDELCTLLVNARALGVKEEYIKSYISRNLILIKKVFFKVLEKPNRENQWLISFIPETVKLNCVLKDFSDEHFCTLRIFNVKIDSLFPLSPIMYCLRTNNKELLIKLLRAGCSVTTLFTPYPNPIVVQFFRDKIQPEMTLSQQTAVCIKELVQLGAIFEPDALFEDDLLVKILMRDEPIDQELLALVKKHPLADKRQNGMTVLRWACGLPFDKSNTITNLIRHLLLYHFSPDDSGDASFDPPLKVLLDNKRTSLVPHFIDHYVNLNVVIRGKTTLLHEVLSHCSRVSLEKIGSRLNVFMLDARGRAPVDIAFETHNRQFLKQVIEPRCGFKLPQKTFTKQAVKEALDSAFEKGQELEALEGALLYNLPELSLKIARTQDFKQLSENLRAIREKHPQLHTSYLLNHFFVIISLTEYSDPNYHPFIRQILQTPCDNPVHYLVSIATLIQRNESSMLNFFFRTIPQDWKNGHFKNLRDHFEAYLEVISQKGLSQENTLELLQELFAKHQLPYIPDKHPIEIIQNLAFEDYLKEYVRKAGSMQSAWEMLIRLGRLKECVPGAVTLLQDAHGKLNFKRVG